MYSKVIYFIISTKTSHNIFLFFTSGLLAPGQAKGIVTTKTRAKTKEFVEPGSVFKLGSGSFGVVVGCRFSRIFGNEIHITKKTVPPLLQFQDTFALKIIKEPELNDLVGEVSCATKLCHPNLVAFYNNWIEGHEAMSEEILDILQNDPDYLSSSLLATSLSSTETAKSCFILRNKYLVIQMELCNFGTLDNYLRTREIGWSFTKQGKLENQSLIRGILEGLNYLEFNNRIHNDLKPDNILLHKVDGRIIPKLTDLGLGKRTYSAIREDGIYDYPDIESEIEADTSGNGDFRRYHSPEKYLGKKITAKHDMYALGLIFLTLMLPYSNISKRNEAIMDAIKIKKNRKYPDEVVAHFPKEIEWIDTLLSHNPLDRYWASEFLKIIRQDGWSLMNSSHISGLSFEFSKLQDVVDDCMRKNVWTTMSVNIHHKYDTCFFDTRHKLHACQLLQELQYEIFASLNDSKCDDDYRQQCAKLPLWQTLPLYYDQLGMLCPSSYFLNSCLIEFGSIWPPEIRLKFTIMLIKSLFSVLGVGKGLKGKITPFIRELLSEIQNYSEYEKLREREEFKPEILEAVLKCNSVAI